jgi:hypothetical protein
MNKRHFLCSCLALVSAPALSTENDQRHKDDDERKGGIFLGGLFLILVFAGIMIDGAKDDEKDD